jgi:hypothetical protein
LLCLRTPPRPLTSALRRHECCGVPGATEPSETLQRMPQVRWDGSPAVALVTEQHASATFIIDGVMPAQAQRVRVLVLPWLIGDHDVEARHAPIPAAAPARSIQLDTLELDAPWAGSWCPVAIERRSATALAVTIGPLLDAGLFHVAVICNGRHAENSPFACDVLPASFAADSRPASSAADSRRREPSPFAPSGLGGSSPYEDGHHGSISALTSRVHSAVGCVVRPGGFQRRLARLHTLTVPSARACPRRRVRRLGSGCTCATRAGGSSASVPSSSSRPPEARAR